MSIFPTFNPDRTILVLSFKQKHAAKTTDKNDRQKTTDKKQPKKTTDKTHRRRQDIVAYLSDHETATTRELSIILGISVDRTRHILLDMSDVEAIGGNKDRRYRLKNTL